MDHARAVAAIHQAGRLMGGLFESIDVLVTSTLAPVRRYQAWWTVST